MSFCIVPLGSLQEIDDSDCPGGSSTTPPSPLATIRSRLQRMRGSVAASPIRSSAVPRVQCESASPAATSSVVTDQTCSRGDRGHIATAVGDTRIDSPVTEGTDREEGDQERDDFEMALNSGVDGEWADGAAVLGVVEEKDREQRKPILTQPSRDRRGARDTVTSTPPFVDSFTRPASSTSDSLSPAAMETSPMSVSSIASNISSTSSSSSQPLSSTSNAVISPSVTTDGKHEDPGRKASSPLEQAFPSEVAVTSKEQLLTLKPSVPLSAKERLAMIQKTLVQLKSPRKRKREETPKKEANPLLSHATKDGDRTEDDNASSNFRPAKKRLSPTTAEADGQYSMFQCGSSLSERKAPMSPPSTYERCQSEDFLMRCSPVPVSVLAAISPKRGDRASPFGIGARGSPMRSLGISSTPVVRQLQLSDCSMNVNNAVVDDGEKSSSERYDEEFEVEETVEELFQTIEEVCSPARNSSEEVEIDGNALSNEASGEESIVHCYKGVLEGQPTETPSKRFFEDPLDSDVWSMIKRKERKAEAKKLSEARQSPDLSASPQKVKSILKVHLPSGAAAAAPSSASSSSSSVSIGSCSLRSSGTRSPSTRSPSRNRRRSSGALPPTPLRLKAAMKNAEVNAGKGHRYAKREAAKSTADLRKRFGDLKRLQQRADRQHRRSEKQQIELSAKKKVTILERSAKETDSANGKMTLPRRTPVKITNSRGSPAPIAGRVSVFSFCEFLGLMDVALFFALFIHSLFVYWPILSFKMCFSLFNATFQ